MSFFGKSFIFDGESSELYNLYITSNQDGGFAKTIGSGDVEIITQKIFRRPEQYLLGTSPSPALTFDLEITSPDEILANDIQFIVSWLCGQTTYKKLQIFQYDISDVYFNCFMISPKIMKSGNKIIGLSVTVICDRPHGITFPKIITKNYATSSVSDSFVFYNTSNNNLYEYPKVTFTINSTGTSINIRNVTDNNRDFSFTTLTSNEVITVNNSLCIITSSLSLRRLEKFNNNWFRVLKGKNVIEITGNPSQVIFEYNPARKIGG